MESVLNLSEAAQWLEIRALAHMVQESVDSGKWAYLAVLSVFVMIEVNKRWLASKLPSVKKNAAQYSAGLGALTGAVLSDDKASGAIGGMLVGNAASGLYSSLLKPISQFLRFDVAGFLTLLLGLAGAVHKSVSKKSAQEKQKVIDEFHEAMKLTKGEEPSTKELEKWMSKHL
jgi:hypothetical protein